MVKIYADGSFIHKTGLAFYGIYAIKSRKKVYRIGGRSGYVRGSNEAECFAVFKAIEYAKYKWLYNEPVIIYTDSKVTLKLIESDLLPGIKKYTLWFKRIISVIKGLALDIYFIRSRENPAHFVVQKARLLNDIKDYGNKSQEKVIFATDTPSFYLF